MNKSIYLSIVICTRNREDDLKNCIKSISNQREIYNDIEVLIIDDGNLSKEYLSWVKDTLDFFNVVYYKKNNPGLFLSRLKSIEMAKGSIILFLDDDVVLEKNYINNLLENYKLYPDVAGIGGIDTLLPSYSLFRAIYTTLFCYNSFDVGKLSLTGFNYSMSRWKNKNNIFETEYLNGCNMSFKKNAIKKLPQMDFFNNYSLGEDLFISLFANKSAKLLVNTKLKVKHFQTPISRDKIENVAKMKITNHYRMLPFLKSGNIKYILIYWTFIGMLIASIIKLDFNELKGYLDGLKDL